MTGRQSPIIDRGQRHRRRNYYLRWPYYSKGHLLAPLLFALLLMSRSLDIKLLLLGLNPGYAAPALASVLTCDAARTGSVSLSVPGLAFIIVGPMNGSGSDPKGEDAYFSPAPEI